MCHCISSVKQQLLNARWEEDNSEQSNCLWVLAASIFVDDNVLIHTSVICQHMCHTDDVVMRSQNNLLSHFQHHACGHAAFGKDEDFSSNHVSMINDVELMSLCVYDLFFVQLGICNHVFQFVLQ